MTKKYFFYLLLMLSFQYYLTYGSSKLITLKETILEENDSIHWTSITNVSFSPNSKLMALSSKTNNSHIAIYNTTNFKISNIYNKDKSVFDSITKKIKFTRPERKLLPIEYYPKEALQNCSFFSVAFENDSTLFLGVDAKYISIPKDQCYDSLKRIYLSGAVVLIRENIYNSYERTAAILQNGFNDYNDMTFSQADNFQFDCENNILYILTTESSLKTSAIGAYNYQGDLIKILYNYPKDITKYRSLTMINYYPIINLDYNSNLLVGFRFYPKVYNAMLNKEFKIQNLLSEPLKIIEKINTDSIYYENVQDSIVHMMQFEIRNIFSDQKNRIILYINTFEGKFKNETIMPRLQLYEQNGSLIEDIPLPYTNENGILNYVYYNKYNDLFYLFRKGEEHWTVEECKWDID